MDVKVIEYSEDFFKGFNTFNDVCIKGKTSLLRV